jgi:hypothetical protein
MSLNLRSIAVASALGLAALSAQANLTIPFNATQSNSVQAFPADVLQLMELVYLEIQAKGTATAVGAVLPETSNPSAFNFPITKIVIGSKLNIASGSAVGAALVFRRANDEGTAYIGLTLANFTIDYVRKQVLADLTPMGGSTTTQAAIYNFHTATPLALKYKFPLTITGHEVLDQLYLTTETKAAFKSSLELPEFALGTLEKDFGTLTQDISTKLRKPAVSTKPYVAN